MKKVKKIGSESVKIRQNIKTQFFYFYYFVKKHKLLICNFFSQIQSTCIWDILGQERVRGSIKKNEKYETK